MDGDMKYGVHGKSKSIERRSRTDSALNCSLGGENAEKMMIVGKSFGLSKSRAVASGYQLHGSHSESSVHPINNSTQHKDSFPSEGLYMAISDHPSVSSISYASAVSEVSTTTVQKKLHEMERDLCNKDATISFLRKQLNLDGDKSTELASVAVETDIVVPVNEDYDLKLCYKIGKRENIVYYLSEELQDTSLLEDKINVECNSPVLTEGSPEPSCEIEWDDLRLKKLTEINERDFLNLKDLVAKLKSQNLTKDTIIHNLQENIKEYVKKLETKEELLEETTKKFLEYKTSSSFDLNNMRQKILSLENDSKEQEKIYNEKMVEQIRNLEDEVILKTKKLESQYHEKVRAAAERCLVCFKKLSEMPKERTENLLKLCELEQFDILLIQKEWENQKTSLEKKINALQEMNKKEIDLLTEGYESKISSLQSQIESLNQQLKERKETLDTFETELKLYRKEKAKCMGSKQEIFNVSELKKMHADEIRSQKEKHKLEKELLQDRVKQLSEEILSHANNEMIHLLELQSAKKTASTFREKYERLVVELENKICAKKNSDYFLKISELNLEDSLQQFRSLIHSLKQAEEIHDSKIKYLKKLYKDEELIHQREIHVFKTKLEQVDCFHAKLLELDNEIQNLIETVEERYTGTIQTFSSCRESEMKLKQMEISSMEMQNAAEVQELRKKLMILEEANEALENEINTNKVNFEKELISLKHNAEELAVELLKSEGKLSLKIEIEETLTKRISQLEHLIEIRNENWKKELEDALSKSLALEALVSAKEEIAREYENKIIDSERILERSCQKADNVEKDCGKLQLSFSKLEDTSQKMQEVNNSEIYYLLKKKTDNLTQEFKDMCDIQKDLENDCERLSTCNLNKIREYGDLTEKYEEIKVERDKTLEKYNRIEENMKSAMEKSYRLETELRKILADNNLIKQKCDDVIKIYRSIENLDMQQDDQMVLSGQRNQECKESTKDISELEQVLVEEKNNKLMKNTNHSESKIVNEKVGISLHKSLNHAEGQYEQHRDTDGKDYTSTTENHVTLSATPNVLQKIFGDNRDLQQENDELKGHKNPAQLKNNPCAEILMKLDYIQKNMLELVYERNNLIKRVETQEDVMKRLKEELVILRKKNDSPQSTELKHRKDLSSSILMEDSLSSGTKLNQLWKGMKELNDCIETAQANQELSQNTNMRNLALGNPNKLNDSNCLNDELDEVWSERFEIEDQLAKLRQENCVLSLHRDQLEQTNKKISCLMSDSSPVISWMKIHETVESIIDVVQAIKISVLDVYSGTGDLDVTTSKPASLHMELENKTRLSEELVSQKVMLEKELGILQSLMKKNEKSQMQLMSESKSSNNKDIQNYPSVMKFSPDPLAENDFNLLGSVMEEPCLATLHKLKKHFETQVHLQEAQLTEALANEIEGIKKEMQSMESMKEKEQLDVLRDKHKEEIKEMKREHETELEKLRKILKEVRENGNNSLLIHEIESKHNKQMEDLRRYFEKKCAELEKNFSEEVFNQHNRKMSIGSETTVEELPDEDTDKEKLESFDEKEDIMGKFKRLLDQQECNNEKKEILVKYVTEIITRHAEELNCMKTKYNKETANLQKRHLLEINKLNEELQLSKKSAEIEKDLLTRDYETRMKNIAIEERKMIAVELDREFENKVKEELKKLGELLEAEAKAQEEESSNLEESCIEKVSGYETEFALKKIEIEKELEKKISLRNEERFRKELEEEKRKIAQHYRDLNEAALKRFNEEQENLIRSHSEVMRRMIQEHEERINDLKRTHKLDLEKIHCDEEIKLIMEFRNKEKNFEKELSSIKSTYEDELFELKKCCQDTLNEQVTLAKADAYNTLQKQLQDYLNGEDEESVTSKEVIELGEKFAGKYRKEIEDLKQRHHGEVTRIRTEYEERIRRRYSTGSLPKKSVEKMEMRTDDDKLQILRERDALQEMVSSLRHVLSELIHYVGSCEDELNNTIVGELGGDEETLYRSFQIDSTRLSETDCSSFMSKKVHFAPDLSGIISEINDSKSLNTSMQVRIELDRCLKQLKTDASHLLALSNPTKRQDENLYELLLKIEEEKNRLVEKVTSVEDMQKELRFDIEKTKVQLAEFERTREVVSEGYGEEIVNSNKQESLMKLKEKAKALVGQNSSHSSDILNVLDEICKEGDRIQDEARREKNDLQQQVAAADKQLRATRKFLEEQAAERESERDDYLNEIKRLNEALKMRERDKTIQDRMNQDMEALENQLRDANGQIMEVEQSKTETKNQLKEAVDKIWTLREIISDLEGQVGNLSEQKAALQCRIEDLETAQAEQIKVNEDLMIELENLRMQSRNEYAEQVKYLEEELSNLRREVERLSPEAVTQLRVSMREIELALTKKTRDLEQLHAPSANISCSSPSEDISMCERLDRTGCPTPDEMQTCGELPKIILPLDEMARISEKLISHTRAEEAAIKMVRDLQIELNNCRKAMEEIQIERDVLLERADSYLQENSRLKVRLDEQRCNAGILQRQLSANLEAQIKRLEFDLERLNELCIQKDKQIRDMNKILEQTTKSLRIREAEVLNKSNEDNETITNLKTELQNTLDEKRKLEETVNKMKESLRETVTVPLLVDSMLEEKNAEIDRLEKELSKISKQRANSSLLRTQSPANSTSSSKSLRRVKFSEPDSFVEFISPITGNEDQSVIRCANESYPDLKISSLQLRKPNNWMATPESQSSIGPLQLSPRGIDSLHWSKTNTLLLSSSKESEEDVDFLQLRKLEKTEKMKRMESKFTENISTDAASEGIREQLKSTNDAGQPVFKECEKMMEIESNLLSELDAKKREISENLLEIDTLKRKLAEANLLLETAKVEHQKVESELLCKDEEIRKLNSNADSLLMTMDTLKKNHTEEVEEYQSKLDFEHNRVESVLEELKILEVKKVEIVEEFMSLKEDYNEKLASQQKTVSKLRTEMSELQIRNKELMESYEKLEEQMSDTLVEAENLSKDLTDELSAVKRENEKLRNDYMGLKNDFERFLNVEKTDVAIQTEFVTNEEPRKTHIKGDLLKAHINDEVTQFQSLIEQLKLEMSSWEQKMIESEFNKDEALSYAALIRTLISTITENLDDHFYELQTYRMRVMECSVDDLTDKVQKELILSAKLDNKLLSNIQTEGMSDSRTEDQSALVENVSGDSISAMSKKKQNLVNLTIKLYELETNLQEMEQRNKEFEAQISVLRDEKDEERRKAEGLEILVKLLEDGLAKEKAKLAEERSRYDEDAKIMEVLRVNFEIFVEKVDELEKALWAERKQRIALEKMLNSSSRDGNDDVTSSLKYQLEVEQQKCSALRLNVEKEKGKNQELKMQLEQEKLERISDRDMQRLLNNDLELLQAQKDNLESQLTFARELLQTRQAEIAVLKRKINLQEIDIKALTISSDNQSEKETEILLMATKISELEKELDHCRSQLQNLNEKSESISSPLVTKMKILNNCVQQHVQESNEMGEALLHLTKETEQMRSLIRKIEETENGVTALSTSSDDTVLADADPEPKSWKNEKESLITKLEKAECDYEFLKKDAEEILKSNDALKLEVKLLKKELETVREEMGTLEQRKMGIPEERVLHLFSRYMRTESFRKALAFQKLYLVGVLKGLENDDEALVKILRSGSSRRKDLRRKRSKRKTFKVVAIAIIAIKRMHFMVARWSICRLTAFNALMGQNDPSTANQEDEYRNKASLSIQCGPIDPLRYQTHNILKRSQANVMRTPPSRDLNLRQRSRDVKKMSENNQKYCTHPTNWGQSSRPP